MAFTKKGDVFVPELLMEAMPGAYAGLLALSGSSVATINTSMPAGKEEVGDTIKIPYFGTIGELQDLTNDGDALTPRNIATTNEQDVVRHSGIAIEATRWARLSGVKDPYKEMARQMMVAVQRRADQALIDAAVAAPTGVTALPGAYDNAVWSTSAPRTFDYDLMVDSKFLFGDEQDDIGLLVVHSKVLKDMLKLKDSTGRPLLMPANDGTFVTFAGVKFRASDRLVADLTNPSFPKYTSLLIKPESLVFWMNGSPEAMVDKDILANSDIAALHIYWASHRYGRRASSTKAGVVRIIHN